MAIVTTNNTIQPITTKATHHTTKPHLLTALSSCFCPHNDHKWVEFNTTTQHNTTQHNNTAQHNNTTTQQHNNTTTQQTVESHLPSNKPQNKCQSKSTLWQFLTSPHKSSQVHTGKSFPSSSSSIFINHQSSIINHHQSSSIIINHHLHLHHHPSMHGSSHGIKWFI